MRNCINLAIYLAVSVLACGTLVYGQADTATIVGTVQDSSGAVIPGGTVTVTATDTGAKTVARTDPIRQLRGHSSSNWKLLSLRGSARVLRQRLSRESCCRFRTACG